MKIFKFVEVATQSHRHEETGGFLRLLRGDRDYLRGVNGKWSSSARSHSFRPYRSFGAIVHAVETCRYNIIFHKKSCIDKNNVILNNNRNLYITCIICILTFVA